MLRLFYAIDLPDVLKSRLEKVNAQPGIFGSHVKPVKGASFHLTMLFLGDQPEGNLKALGEAGKNSVLTARPCELVIGKAGFFPRVSFLTLTGDIETLAFISMNLAVECEKYLEKPETRPFKAHVTIARHKKPVSRSEKETITEMFREFEGERIRIEGLVLFKSELTRSGAIYTILEKFPFSG